MRTHQSGMSLISVVVSMGIGAMVIMFTMHGLALNFKHSQSMKLRNDKESIRLLLEHQVSCDKTLLGKCTPGSLVDVISNKNTLLVSALGTKYDRFTVKAECNSTGDGVVVKSARLNTGGSVSSTDPAVFVPDPLTNKTTLWTDDGSLLQPKGVELCGLASTLKVTCVEGSRRNNTFTGDFNVVFNAFGTTKDYWGLTCKAPYFRATCALSTLPSIGTDTDLVLIPQGCSSDNEEWDEQQMMTISCCKVN